MPQSRKNELKLFQDDGLKLYGPDEAAKELGLATHSLRFTSTVGIKDKSPIDVTRQCVLKTIENSLDGTGLIDYKLNMNENGERPNEAWWKLRKNQVEKTYMAPIPLSDHYEPLNRHNKFTSD